MALVSDKGKRQKNNIDSFPDKVLKVAYNLLFAVQMRTTEHKGNTDFY
jgi:hypothetical protein